MIDVLDACAMIAYLLGEPGGEVVDARLRDPNVVCYAHSINLCEVYYDFIRKHDLATAENAIQDLRLDGVTERSDFGSTFWRRVGKHKARGKISLADCVCLALAEEVGGRVLTSDRKEFGPINLLGICPIVFIR